MPKDLSFTISGDASSFSAAAKKFISSTGDMEKAAAQFNAALKNMGGGDAAGGKGSGLVGLTEAAGSVQSFSKATKEGKTFIDSHSDSVARLGKRYQELDQKASWAKDEPERLKKIRSEQSGILKNLEGLAKSQDQYNAAVKRTKEFHQENQDVLARSTQQYSAHSQRQYEQLRGIGVAQVGAGLAGLGRMASQVAGQQYDQSVSAYDQLNKKWRFDEPLLESQANKRRAELAQGGRLSGIEAAKNNASAGFMNGPFGDLGAAVGKYGGQALEIGGNVAMLAGGLKTLGMLGKGAAAASTVAGAAGTAASVGGAAEAFGVGGLVAGGAKAGGAAAAGGGALGLLGTIAGIGATVGAGALAGNAAGSAITGGNNLAMFWDSQGQGRQQAQSVIQSDDFKKSLSGMSDQDRRKSAEFYDSAIPVMRELQKSRASWSGGEAGIVSDKGKEDAAIEKLKKVYEKSGKTLTKDQEDLLRSNGLKSDQLLSQFQEYSKAYGGKGEAAGTGDGKSALDKYTSGSGFKLEQQKLNNKIADFAVDQGRQITEVTRNYQRQQEDFTKQGKRIGEDYAIQLKHFAVERQRVEEDTAKNIYRTTADYNKGRARTEQDYTLAVQKWELGNQRFERDQQIGLTRFYQDQSIARVRFQEEQAVQTQRLVEDTTKQLTYTYEDYNTNRQRADQDYARNRMQLERQNARSIEDLNRGLSDTLLSIMAPGLGQNKAFQIGKALRDSSIQKKRLGEDYQFNKQGLDTNYQRGIEDSTKQLTRSLDALTTTFTRANEDMARAAQYFAEDQGLAEQRASQDALIASTDHLVDSTMALDEMNIQHARTIEDADTNFTRAMDDITVNYRRAIEDQTMAQEEAALAHQRALEDLATSERRAKEDFDFSMEGIKITADRFARDMGLSLQETMNGIRDETGAAMSDIAKLYQSAMANISAAQAQAQGGTPHATGLERVPYDRYKATLHKDEMVLTAQEADQYRQAKGSAPSGGTDDSSGTDKDTITPTYTRMPQRNDTWAGFGGGTMRGYTPDTGGFNPVDSGNAGKEFGDEAGKKVKDGLDKGSDKVKQGLKDGFDKGSDKVKQGLKDGLDKGADKLKQTLDKAGSNLASQLSKALTPAKKPVSGGGGGSGSETVIVGGSTIGYGNIPSGYHASGLPSVPYNGYRATLHQGEMIVPRGQADQMRLTPPTNGSYGAQTHIAPTFNITVGTKEQAAKVKDMSRGFLQLLEQTLGR